MWNLNWYNIWKYSLPKFWEEIPLIFAIVDEYTEKYRSIVDRNKDINLYALSLAVRRQENGGAGFEFGVIAAKNTNLEEQARWAVVTFLKNIERWERARKNGEWKPQNSLPVLDYIVFLGNRWAPVGASNDPKNLNKYWIDNVQKLYQKYERS